MRGSPSTDHSPAPPRSPYRACLAGSDKASVSTARAAGISARLGGTVRTQREPAYQRRTWRVASATSPVVPMSRTCAPMRAGRVGYGYAIDRSRP